MKFDNESLKNAVKEWSETDKEQNLNMVIFRTRILVMLQIWDIYLKNVIVLMKNCFGILAML